jgi:predicted Zn-dependent protease
MSGEQLQDLMQHALRLSEADQTEIVALTTDNALTWYAENVIHQNVAEHTAQISVRVVVGKKVGSASTTDCTSDGLALVVQQAGRIARLMPDTPEFPGLPLPAASVSAESIAAIGERTSTMTGSQPEERVLAVKKIIERSERAGLRAAGSYQIQNTDLAIVSSTGVNAQGRTAVAALKAVVMGDDSSGYGYAASADAESIDPETVGEQAVRTALETRHPSEIRPGAYDVVLSPFAVGELMSLMAWSFSAKSVEEHVCFLDGHKGEQLVAPVVSVYDDGTDPAGLPFPFDFEGMPRQRVDFLAKGRGGDVVYDSCTAARMGRATTGHALQQPNDIGPYPLHLFMDAGDSTEDTMVSHVERGIYVSRFWYGNVVEPRRVVVTGTSRDGTYLIENGRKVCGIHNLRFTQGLVDMLAHTVEMTHRRTVLASSFGIGAMVLPGIRAGNFQFTGVTR